MAKPAILTVDDDPAVSQAIARDLRRQYGAEFQIVRANSGPEALSVMKERARFMAQQPGFISVSLHRSLDGKRIVNYVQWQSRDQLQAAHRSPEFRKEWGEFDALTETIDPHLYEVAEVLDAKQ